MDERMLSMLLDMAERWANTARTSLVDRASVTPLVFAAGRRPEERAALACAVELFDMLACQPCAQVLLRELGLPGRPDVLPMAHAAAGASQPEAEGRGAAQ